MSSQTNLVVGAALVAFLLFLVYEATAPYLGLPVFQ
jgi:hypothetical protein